MASRLKFFLDRWAAQKLGIPEDEVTLDVMREKLRSPRGLGNILKLRVGGRIDNHLRDVTVEEEEKLLEDADYLLSEFASSSR